MSKAQATCTAALESSNDAIKQCVEENRRVIELVETAAAIPNCDWGRDDPRGLELLLPELGKIRLTAFLLTADTQILAEKREHKAPLKQGSSRGERPQNRHGGPGDVPCGDLRLIPESIGIVQSYLLGEQKCFHFF